MELPFRGHRCDGARSRGRHPRADGHRAWSHPTAIVRRYFDERAFCPVAFGDVAGMAQAIRRVRDDEAYRAGLVVNACVQMEPIRWPLMATRFVEACGFGAGRMQAERPA